MPIPVVESVSEDDEVDVSDGTSTLAQPAGTSAGEFIFPFVGVESDGTATSPFDDVDDKPAGCTLIDDFGDTGNVDVWAAAYYREITGGESWPLAVAFTVGDPAADFCGITLRVSGVNASNPINAVGTPITFLSVTDEIIPSINTTVDDCLGVAMYIFDGADGSPIALHADSIAEGWTLAAEHLVNTGAVGLSLAVATKDQATAGALGDCRFEPVASDGGAGLMFAIEGAAGGSGISEEASLGAIFSPVIHVPVSFTAGISAGDTQSAAVHVSVSIIEGIAAADTPGDSVAVVSDILAGIEADEQMTALAQASAAIVAGAAAGESWVDAVQTSVSFSAGSQLASSFSAETEAAVNRAISEGSTAAASFAAACAVLSSITEAATLGESMQIVASVIAAISESVAAGDTWEYSTAGPASSISEGASLAGQFLASIAGFESLLAAISAQAVFEASAAIQASISEGVSLGAVFSISQAGGRYITISAIEVLAAISATSVSADSEVDVTGISIDPEG